MRWACLIGPKSFESWILYSDHRSCSHPRTYCLWLHLLFYTLVCLWLNPVACPGCIFDISTSVIFSKVNASGGTRYVLRWHTSRWRLPKEVFAHLVLMKSEHLLPHNFWSNLHLIFQAPYKTWVITNMYLFFFCLVIIAHSHCAWSLESSFNSMGLVVGGCFPMIFHW